MRPTQAWFGLLSQTAEPAQRSITKFVERVRDSQANASKSLLQVVDDQIQIHRHTLARHLRASSTDVDECESEIWRRLEFYSHDTIEQDLKILAARDDRLVNLSMSSHDTAKRQLFIRELYPIESELELLGGAKTRRVIDWTSRLEKYGKVDHQRLYHAYRDLRDPAISQLSSTELDKLLHEFLFGMRSFKKPNAILKSFVREKPQALVTRAFHEMIGLRKCHLGMVMRITKDMKDAGVQLLNRERCGVLYMTLFRDNPKIVDSVEGAQASYSDLLMEVYNMIIEKFDEKGQLSTDVLNTMLFHAITRDKLDIIGDILLKFGLDGEAGGIKKPNLVTFKLLMGFFGEKQMRNSLTHVINNISSGAFPLDISVINKCISSLVSCDETEEAELILSHIFPREVPPRVTYEADSESIMYKQLSFQDRRLYRTLFQIHQNISQITGSSEPFTIHPTIETFKPLICYFCDHPSRTGSLNKVHGLLTIMTDTYKLPIDTHTYQAAFNWHKKSQSIPTPLEWEILLLVTTRLIIDHDHLYNITQDTSYFEMARVGEERNTSESLQHFFNGPAASPATTLAAPTWAGNFVKFSDSLVECVYDAFIATLDRVMKGPLDKDALMLLEAASNTRDAIVKQRQELQIQLSKAPHKRQYRRGVRRKDLYQLDEYALIKKEYLLQLVEIAETYSES